VDDRGSIPDRSREGFLTLRLCVHNGSGAHPAAYPVGTGKLPGREADHCPPSVVKAENAWSYTSILHASSWRGALLR
jgi:hypothetical protein